MMNAGKVISSRRGEQKSPARGSGLAGQLPARGRIGDWKIGGIVVTDSCFHHLNSCAPPELTEPKRFLHDWVGYWGEATSVLAVLLGASPSIGGGVGLGQVERHGRQVDLSCRGVVDNFHADGLLEASRKGDAAQKSFAGSVAFERRES